MSYNLRRDNPKRAWMDDEEAHMYHKIGGQMSREGYNPGKAFREDTVIWSHNCQMANDTRLRDWSYEYKNAMVLMQGTQRVYDPTLGEKHCAHWQTDFHDIVEARVPKK